MKLLSVVLSFALLLGANLLASQLKRHHALPPAHGPAASLLKTTQAGVNTHSNARTPSVSFPRN